MLTAPYEDVRYGAVIYDWSRVAAWVRSMLIAFCRSAQQQPRNYHRPAHTHTLHRNKHKHGQMAAETCGPLAWLKNNTYAMPYLCLHLLSYSRFFYIGLFASDGHSVIKTITSLKTQCRYYVSNNSVWMKVSMAFRLWVDGRHGTNGQCGLTQRAPESTTTRSTPTTLKNFSDNLQFWGNPATGIQVSQARWIVALCFWAISKK